jgi:hypothetical protein
MLHRRGSRLAPPNEHLTPYFTQKEPPPCDTYVALSLPVVIMVQEFVSLNTQARTARGDMAIRRN